MNDLSMASISERWILWADVSGSTSFAAEVYRKYGRLDTDGALSREFQPYWTAIIDTYKDADRLAQERQGSLANTMGDGFFLLGPAMCGYGTPTQWVPDLLDLSRELKTKADDRLSKVGDMKLKVCLHMGTVHEVPFDGRSAFFGDALNYAARVLGVSYKRKDVPKDVSEDYIEDYIVATADGPSGIEGIAHLIRDYGYRDKDAGDEIEVKIYYPAKEEQVVKIRRYSKDVWSKMPTKRD